MGGTTPVIMGGPSLRIKVLPILGQAFGGNYAFLVWDEADEKKRCIAVDPADPYPVLRAAQVRKIGCSDKPPPAFQEEEPPPALQEEGLEIDVVLTTHWHFDHSGGNNTLAQLLPGVHVIRRTSPGSGRGRGVGRKA